MINRRSFLKFLAAIPVLGLVAPFAPRTEVEPDAAVINLKKLTEAGRLLDEKDVQVGNRLGKEPAYVKQFRENTLRIAKQERGKIRYG